LLLNRRVRHVRIRNNCFIGVNATLRNSITIAPGKLLLAQARRRERHGRKGVYAPPGRCSQEGDEIELCRHRKDPVSVDGFQRDALDKEEDGFFEPPGQLGWVASHAAVPIAHCVGGDRFRIYFSGRDPLNRAQMGYIEVDIREHRKCLPGLLNLLSEWKVGNFDDSGAMEVDRPAWSRALSLLHGLESRRHCAVSEIPSIGDQPGWWEDFCKAV
jgi:hypothetical protein